MAITVSAASLFALVEDFGPRVERDELIFEFELPKNFESLVSIVHTGIRALLTERTWYGCGSEVKTAAAVALIPSAPIPLDVTLLAVGGDLCWDRIHPATRIDHPELFACVTQNRFF